VNLKRNKRWGYEVEVRACERLSQVFPKLRRTGSTGYSKAAADLVQDGSGPAVYLIVTQDKQRDPIVSMTIPDLLLLLTCPIPHSDLRVYVQVKARERTWIGRLRDDLVDAVRREHSERSSKKQVPTSSGSTLQDGSGSAAPGTTTGTRRRRSTKKRRSTTASAAG
jgi:hypothetical protein